MGLCFLIYPMPNTFVQKDIETLKNLGVRVIAKQVKPTKNPVVFAFRQVHSFVAAFFKLPQANVFISWFSDYHTLIPLLLAKLWGTKSLIIVGGFDAVSDPENQYGIFYKKGLRQQVARWNYALADSIWVVDNSLREGCIPSKRNGIASGLLHWMPELNPKIEVVPTSYNSNFWRRNQQPRPKTILTVASITSEQVIRRKGIPLFIEMAKQTPDWTFTIAGDGLGLVKNQNNLPKNLNVLGKQPAASLVDLYSQHQIYFQASRVEGLPNVLCEAMLCECIPMGQDAFGIPTAIGHTGILFKTPLKPETFHNLLDCAAAKNPVDCRRRIMENFQDDRRINKLKQLFT